MSEKSEPLGELRSLLARLCEGNLDSGGYQRIEQLVRGNPAARQLYIDTILLHGELHWASARPAPAALEIGVPVEVDGHQRDGTRASTVPRAAGYALPRRRRSLFSVFSRPLPLTGAAVAAGLLVALGLFAYRAGVDRVVGQPEEAVVVAELEADHGCVWAGTEQELAEGTPLVSGQRLELTAGVVKLLFRHGATVLVESPATFELVSATSLRLKRGTVAVRASGPVKDFVVISPDASIVDLGTSFGVHCDGQGATEVEVFEGEVEVFPESSPKQGRVLGMGTSASVGQQGKEVPPVASLEQERRFINLLQWLWEDMRVAALDDADPVDTGAVEAEFADGPVPGTIDTFYDALPGRGWLTPWVAAGNPTGEIRRDDPHFGHDNPFLHVRFKQSFERAIAREYGPRPGFDPTQPHVISWRWRLEGNPDHFGGDFQDRVAFYGNPFFRRNSWPTNSWLIGVAGGDEVAGRRSISTDWLRRKRLLVDGDEIGVEPRRVFPMRWYFFDNQAEGGAGAVFDHRNMVDTGMTLKPGVLYHFAVAVYPQEARYDAAIRDDEQTVVHTGLSFRNRSVEPAGVLHFTISANDSDDDLGFSLASVRIQPLKDMDVQKQLEMETAADEGGNKE